MVLSTRQHDVTFRKADRHSGSLSTFLSAFNILFNFVCVEFRFCGFLTYRGAVCISHFEITLVE
jgi:hypothetical protein